MFFFPRNPKKRQGRSPRFFLEGHPFFFAKLSHFLRDFETGNVETPRRKGGIQGREGLEVLDSNSSGIYCIEVGRSTV